MTQGELAIWSAMAGVLGLLMLAALSEFVQRPTVPSLRGVLFMGVTGGACVLLSALPEALAPGWQGEWLPPIKAAIGPLSGALALGYLGIWTGAMDDDTLVRRTVRWGCAGLVLAGVVLAGLSLARPKMPAEVLGLSAAVNGVSVVLATVVAVRTALLGDYLARWMTLACVCLAGMVAGLYAKGLQMYGGALWVWALTALCTVAYFLVVIALTISRNREQRRLQRLARNSLEGQDTAGVSKGAQLVRQIDDAIWRSARLHRSCAVIAVSVPNLYQPIDASGAEADEAILTTLAARLRRQVGFRNVVGLYHPRCFVLAVSAVQDANRSAVVASELARHIGRPLRIRGGNSDVWVTPTIGIGLVHVNMPGALAVDVINLAEKLALQVAGHDNRCAVIDWRQHIANIKQPGMAAA